MSTRDPGFLREVHLVGIRSRDRCFLKTILLVFGAGLTWIGVLIWCPSQEQACQRQLAAALASRDRSSVESLFPEAYQSRGHDPYHIALVAEAASIRSEHELALELFQELPRDGGHWEFIAERGKARRYDVEGRLREAEISLRRALAISPNDVEILERLGHLLQVEGRAWEASDYFFRQLLQGKCRGDELLGVAANERFIREDERLQNLAIERQPPENLIYLALARRAGMDEKAEVVDRYLQTVVADYPEIGEAQGRLGRVIVDRGRLDEFLHWRGALPEEARQHPEVWFAQGLKARQDGQLEGAVRCFLEALSLAPNHVAATVQVASCLQQLGHKEDAEAFRKRGEWLAELDLLINIGRSDSTPDNYLKLIPPLEKLGRHWEAAGWAYVLHFLPFDKAVAQSELRQAIQHIQEQRITAVQDPQKLPRLIRERQQFALPRWSLPDSTRPPAIAPTEVVTWNFQSVADHVGLDFQYYEGTTEANRLEHIFNVMGGGLAAFDYDGDGWPDLYFAQGHQWHDPQPQPEYFDCLFRNRDGERFDEVAQFAGLGDLSFSHGVAVGDFDQDGWPDIYLGNLGPNRLYRNNGDGTFTEVADAAGVGGDEWTTSSVFADFNSDSLPDLYVLNYTKKDETARKKCGTPEKQQSCTPDALTAEDHRCYINLGDGRFRDVSTTCGILGTPGKGLGVVSWDYAHDGRIGLFVANDTTPNFFFVNQRTDAAGTPTFSNEAVVRGVAYDVDGNVQASMGVAAGDINGDGRIDIFITDFFAAGNALYCQGPDGFFEDRSRAFGIHEPSLTMLGFGCQYADLDGDGWLDIIITNGHVDQKTARGGPDRMPPQIYRNIRGERFELVPSTELGPFFQGVYLGRGLATLDWNRDGRTDFAVSHLHAPAALVTNLTPSRYRPMVVRLVGRRGTREPTGATVTLVGSQPLQARLQTGGDGFLVTNEHRHQFAIPQQQTHAHLQVRWPNGNVQDFPAVAPSTEMLLIEDRTEPIVLRTLAE